MNSSEPGYSLNPDCMCKEQSVPIAQRLLRLNVDGQDSPGTYSSKPHRPCVCSCWSEWDKTAGPSGETHPGMGWTGTAGGARYSPVLYTGPVLWERTGEVSRGSRFLSSMGIKCSHKIVQRISYVLQPSRLLFLHWAVCWPDPPFGSGRRRDGNATALTSGKSADAPLQEKG